MEKEVKPISAECQAAIDKLIVEAPAKWRGSICAGACLDRNTGRTMGGSLNGDVCHYWTRPAGSQHIIFNTTKNIKSDAQRAFAKWVVQDSPFAYGVLNRDNLEQIYHGGMVIDCGLVGEAGGLWLCKAMRYIYESPGRVEQFGRLVALGLPPKAAFFVCSSYGSYSGSSGTSHKGDNVSSYCDHNQVQTNISKDKFVRAYKVTKAKKDTSRETRSAICGEVLTGCNEDWLGFGGSKAVQVPDGWGGFTEKRVPIDEEKAVAELLKFLEEKGLN